jgi:hypothetical protein
MGFRTHFLEDRQTPCTPLFGETVPCVGPIPCQDCPLITFLVILPPVGRVTVPVRLPLLVTFPVKVSLLILFAVRRALPPR